jgi:hypothetical protein
MTNFAMAAPARAQSPAATPLIPLSEMNLEDRSMSCRMSFTSWSVSVDWFVGSIEKRFDIQSKLLNFILPNNPIIFFKEPQAM